MFAQNLVRCRLTRVVVFKPARNVVLQAQRIDASFSRSKMMRLRKEELVAACEEYGLDASGNKSVLTNALMSHFEATAPEEAMEDAVVMKQAAALAPRPVYLDAVTPNNDQVVQDLANKVKALDAAIEFRAQQLQESHTSDQAQLASLVSELDEMRSEWQTKLEAINSALTVATEERTAFSELTALRRQQSELQEVVEGLQRMLKLRDEELTSLTHQLDQVKKQQANAAAEQHSERLAVLAITSELAASGAMPYGPAPGMPRTGYTLPADFGWGGEGSASQSAAAGAAIHTMQARAMSADQTRLFGPALPALVFCGAVSAVVEHYKALRVSLVGHERLVLDGGAIVLATAFVTRLAMI